MYPLRYVPDFSYDTLYTLSIVEGVREDCLGLFQTADTLSEEEVCSCVQCVPEHHVQGVNLWTLLDLGYKNLGMLFEDVDIAEAILDELGSNKLARVMPQLAVCGENTCIVLLASDLALS
jgi:hypothetical protein